MAKAAKKAPLSEDRARQLLAAERERTEGELESVARRLGVELRQVLDEAASEDDANLIEEEAKDQALARSHRRQLKAIERAEQRLADGTYGFSVESGEPIPAKRLERIPWAERTKEEEERYGAGRRLTPGRLRRRASRGRPWATALGLVRCANPTASPPNMVFLRSGVA